MAHFKMSKGPKFSKQIQVANMPIKICPTTTANLKMWIKSTVKSITATMGAHKNGDYEDLWRPVCKLITNILYKKL